jgi:diguanylate cyclase (GGDEF)-like protein
LTGSQLYNNTEEGRLSRLLHGMLFIILILGVLGVTEYSRRAGFHIPADLVSVGALIFLLMAYFLNIRRYFKSAAILSIGTIILTIFFTLWLQRGSIDSSANLLFYLVVPILLGEFFLSQTGYAIMSVLILLGIAVFIPIDNNIANILVFMLLFCFLVGLAGYYRHKLEVARQEQLLSIERGRARQVELLNKITSTMLQLPDLRNALQLLADQVDKLMEADGAFITLWDDDRKQVLPMTAYGDYRETHADLNLEPGENTLTASVLREERPLLVEDLRNTPYMNPKLASDVTTHSVLALPMIANEQKLGAVLISYNKPRHFTVEEIALGEQAAGQIALAVYKAQLYENEVRRAKQLALLEEVGRKIADSLDEMEILQRTVKTVVNRFGYAEAVISLLVEENFLEVTAISGTEDFGYRPGYRQEIGQGIMGHVAEIRTPYNTGDVSQDAYYFSSAKRNGSALAVPMFNKDELFGVIYVETTQRNHFKPDDVQTLQTLANQVATAIEKARLYARAQRHIQVMTILQSVSDAVTSSLDLTEILSSVIELLKNACGYSYISVYLLDGQMLRLGAELGYPIDLIINEVPITAGIMGRTVRTRVAQFITDVNSDPAFLRASYEVKSEICVPLLKNDLVLGVLNVESKAESPLTESDMRLLNALAGPLAVAVDNARLHAAAKVLALTDAMSGLANRRAFDEVLQSELLRARRYNMHLSLIILDLDSFKRFNDQYGHPAGDERLKAIAEMLKENVREPDLAARYGGEEFAVILPNTSKGGAIKLANRLCRSAESSAPNPVHSNGAIPGYTISLGVATFPEDAATAEDLLLAADNAELMAKRLGKNRVFSASPLDTFPT